MIEIREKKDCCGCTACKNICPVHAITMTADEEGFLYPVVDLSVCIQCGRCDKICPVKHKKIHEMEVTTKVYAAYNKNKALRLASSSGGIFALLSGVVLSQNGVVYGAAFDEEFRVCHRRAACIEELKALQGSKYVQSDLQDCFLQIKEDLIHQKLVLFSGTSCQVAGLKAYLRKDYDNLICVDLICKGVPSPKVWHLYRSLLVKNGQLKKFYFKDKTYGWDRFSIRFAVNDKEHIQIGLLNPYMQLFFRHLDLRPSCYACQFKGFPRYSDLTLADCWGFQEIAPELNDNQGLSSVFIHSEKGANLWKKIISEICFKETTISLATKSNPYAYQSAEYYEEREQFFKDLEESPFFQVLKKYGKIPKKEICHIYFSQFKRKIRKRKG